MDRPFAPQRVFHYSKADWDSLRIFYSSYRWSSGCSNDLSFSASFITDAIFLGMDLFTPSSYNPDNKNSPKWFKSQCAKAVNNKNHYFKEWKRLQTQHSRTSFINSRNTCSKSIKNAKSSFVKRINNKIASYQTGSRSFWSMAKVFSQNFCQSSFPLLKTTLTLLLLLLHPRPIFLHQSLPPTPTWTTKGSNHITSPLQSSPCHPLSSPHEKSAKPFSSLTPPNPKALVVFQQQFSKPVLLNLPLFLTNYSSFPTLLAHFPPHGNKPASFLSQKR